MRNLSSFLFSRVYRVHWVHSFQCLVHHRPPNSICKYMKANRWQAGCVLVQMFTVVHQHLLWWIAQSQVSVTFIHRVPLRNCLWSKWEEKFLKKHTRAKFHNMATKRSDTFCIETGVGSPTSTRSPEVLKWLQVMLAACKIATLVTQLFFCSYLSLSFTLCLISGRSLILLASDCFYSSWFKLTCLYIVRSTQKKKKQRRNSKYA